MITNIREFVLNKFKRYSAISGEKALFPFIIKDFTKENNEVTLHNGTELIGSYISVVNNKEHPYLFIHMDRVPLYKKPTIIVTDNTITAQLDNLISVAIAKFLFDNDFGYNFVFTTREECGDSAPQLEDYLDRVEGAKKLQFIDLDIDQIYDLSEIPNGEITLRANDRLSNFNIMLVDKLKTLSNKYDIPFLSVEANNNRKVISQAGMLAKYTPYKSAFVGMPLINLHTGNETTRWDVIENAVKLLCIFYMEKQDGFKKESN